MVVKTVGLVLNPSKHQAVRLADALTELVRSSHRRIVSEASPGLDWPDQPEPMTLDELVCESDIICVLGGDGSMLRVQRKAAPAGKPVLGIQYGRYGFIMETEPEDAPEALDAILRGKGKVKTRLMLQARCRRGRASIGPSYALNDIVVSRGPLSRLLHLRVTVEEREVIRYAADGIIMATPTGSTAYSLSAGGPVIHPDLDAIVLTPIAPHTLNSRSLVIPAAADIELQCLDDTGAAVLSVDGQQMEQLEQGDVVRVERAPFVARMVHAHGSAFYQQLESRLGFGERFDR